jgi:hypothetical protein
MSSILIAVLRFLAITLVPPPVSGGGVEARSSMKETATESEEIRRTYQLAAGSQLEVTRVAVGSFLILPTDTDLAEVHIVRSAKDRSELDCGKLVIEHSPTKLVLRGDEKSACPGRDITLRQDVTLRIPRRSGVCLVDIQGPIILGEIEGRGPNFIKGPDGRKIRQPADRPSVVGRGFSGDVRISGIRGPIRFLQGAGDSEISDISGPLVVSVRGLGARGLGVKNVGDNVEIVLSDGLNADLSVRGVKGQVLTGKPEGDARPTGRRDFNERAGAGGAPISLTGIVGDVVIRRN